MIKVNSYKDHDGNVVKVGDHISEVDYDGSDKRFFGEVLAIRKQGYYVHPETTVTTRKNQLWGKFTRKVKE